MLSRICQLLRRKFYDVDSLYTHGYIDYRGLQPYPKSTLHKSKQNKN